MNSLVLAIIGIAMMVAGYLLYSKFLGRRIFRLSPNYSTPAHTMEDGVDYVPTNKYVLWGHHFTSVAGAAPIIGPARSRRSVGLPAPQGPIHWYLVWALYRQARA